VIEDDGWVGYAYLLDSHGRTCGDVWLYNCAAAPREPEWSDRDKAPFTNPEAYVEADSGFSPPPTSDDFSVEWGENGAIPEARIFICRLAAKLVAGARPGWSALAKKGGPLANVLEK
jgi:hypothetical protein